MNAEISPYSERFKEYLQAACAKNEISGCVDKVISCIPNMLRLEEERCSQTEPMLRDILVVLEADQSPAQLKEVFLET